MSSPHVRRVVRGAGLSARLCVFLVALTLTGCAWAADAGKAVGSAKAGGTGFVETSPPPVELGIGAGTNGTSDVTTEPGEVKPSPRPAGSSSTPEVDIAEIGRLMDSQPVGGATAGTAPSGPRDLDPGNYIWRSAASLSFVLMLIVLVVFALRKYGRRSPLLTALAGPGLATVIGKVHLGRGASLHYVETGGRVLVVGVTQTSVSLVAEFDAAAFEPSHDDVPEEGAALQGRNAPVPRPADKPKLNFFQQLLNSSGAMNHAAPAATDDPDITQLRGDIERLQRHLQELSRESRD